MFSFTSGTKKGDSGDSSLKRRFLFVEVIEAKQIVALAKNVSDPLAHIALTDLGGREIKKEVFRSKQKLGTLTPQWNEKFTMGKKCILFSIFVSVDVVWIVAVGAIHIN
jgi:hypothetical protein